MICQHDMNLVDGIGINLLLDMVRGDSKVVGMATQVQITLSMSTQLEVEIPRSMTLQSTSGGSKT